jgi:hypothetical protein
MTREVMAAEWVVGQQHEPPAAAHLVVLAGIAVAALAIFGVKRWRDRRTAGGNEDEPSSRDGSAEDTRSWEDE